MFVNHISPEQMKQIINKNLLARVVQPLELAQQVNKKRKLKKRNLTDLIKNGISDREQSSNSYSQHIKSQDVSLIKYKQDSQEDSIIRVYTDSPLPLQQECQQQSQNGDKKHSQHIQNSYSPLVNNQDSLNNKKEQLNNKVEQLINKDEQLNNKDEQLNNKDEQLNSKDEQQNNNKDEQCNSKDDQGNRKEEKISNNQDEKVERRKNKRKEQKKQQKQSSDRKQHTSMNDIERDNLIIQKYNMMQYSPYSDSKQKQKIRNTLMPIIEARSQERQNRQRRLQPLKESINISTTNTQNSYVQQITNNSFRQQDQYNQSNTNTIQSYNKNPLLQLRPRSSSQKSSPSKIISSALCYSHKLNYSSVQDNHNISFYTQNSHRNQRQILSHRSTGQNAVQEEEERSITTDYSTLIKNRKILDEKLYLTQFSAKNIKSSINSSKQSSVQAVSIKNNLSQIAGINTQIGGMNTQIGGLNNQNNGGGNNSIGGMNFYDNANDTLKNRQKNKILRSSSSKKQNEQKMNSIEKIYKRKQSCAIEPFSPSSKMRLQRSPSMKQKKKIQSIQPKDIQLNQSTQKSSNGESILPTIQETSSTQNK